MRILVLPWTGSDYDSLSGNLELASRELMADGFEVTRFPLDTGGCPAGLADLLQKESFTFALGMSGVGADLLTPEGTCLWEKTRTPFFTWHCDHPAHYPKLHRILSRYVVQGYVFPDHAHFAGRHVSAGGQAYHVHMGIPRRSLLKVPPLPTDKRNGRLIFAKSGGDPREIEREWRETYSPDLRDILFAATEELSGKKIQEFDTVIGRIAQAFGYNLAPSSDLMLMLVYLVENYLRIRQSNLVLRSLLDFPVDVFGNGWDHIDASHARAVMHGPIPFAEMWALLPRYAGSISVNPLVDESVHDRVFYALAAAVAPIGDANGFCRNELPELRDYSYAMAPEAIAAAADAVLSHPGRAAMAADDCYGNALPRYSMEQSLRQISHFCRMQTQMKYSSLPQAQEGNGSRPAV